MNLKITTKHVIINRNIKKKNLNRKSRKNKTQNKNVQKIIK